MANPTANLCILHGTIASEVKHTYDLTRKIDQAQFWLSHPLAENKSQATPIRLLGHVANAVRELPVGTKITVEGKLRESDNNKYLKIIEGWIASW